MRYTIGDIQHNKAGFESLAHLYAQTKACLFDDIEFDMGSVRWVDADMCSSLGAVLHHLKNNLNSVQLTNLVPAVKQIFLKNKFLSHYGHPAIPDHWETTIPFSRFDESDIQAFARYIETQFFQRPELPAMSTALKRRLRQSIFEMFDNAVQHADSQLGYFSCGQYYPRRHELHFCLTDLGVGFRKNVSEHLKQNLSPEQAIEWATQEGNTTRIGKVPGGLGLRLLVEFIDLNGGCIQIVSDAGYWKRQDKKTSKDRMRYQFPGTIVNIGINTSDKNSYQLSTESTTADIF